jgi:hypothetical protein
MIVRARQALWHLAAIGSMAAVGGGALSVPALGQQPAPAEGRRVTPGDRSVAAPQGSDTGADIGGPEPMRGAGQGPGAQGPLRQQLEQRLRMRVEQVVRQRLHLNDEQMQRLRQSNSRWAPRRRELATRERGIRAEMRQELRAGGTADQQHLSVLIDSLFVLQRSRLDMLQDEQRELSTFLTPEQRVRYYALQEQLRRRVEAMRLRGGQGLGR